MLKQLVTGIIVSSAVIVLSSPSYAGPQHHPHSRVAPHKHHQPRQSISRHTRHHRPRHHIRHRHHHRGHHHHPRHRAHRPHHHSFIRVHIGGHHRPHYPHGHHQHIHDDYCPIIIVPPGSVHRNIVIDWEVEYYDSHSTPDETSVYVIVAPHQGDVYLNGQYIGPAKSFKHGEKRMIVPPGAHQIQLRTGGRSYTQNVTIKPGGTAVVKAKRL